ncbi:MAG: hypothetical protein IJS50_01540 [Desulfovibrio sp.]|nr:hypothetical protein [Desulfovibrio sp.]
MHNTLVISFLSDWHVAAGVGDGYLVDSVLLRDGDGFPYIPGRALRGALRSGAKRLGLCRPDLRMAEQYFWEGGFENDPKLWTLRVSSAHFAEGLKRQLLGHSQAKQLTSDLTILRSNNALTEEGVSKKGSLHTQECGIQGLDLYATLSVNAPAGFSEAWLEAYFAAVCAMVKSLGANRSRGFGRCRLSLLDYRKTVVLPEVNAYLGQLAGKAC